MKHWNIEQILSLPTERPRGQDASPIQAVKANAMRSLRRGVGIENGRKVQNRAAGARMPPCHSVVIAGEGTDNGARRLTPAGRPGHRIDADGPETTTTVTRPLRSPAMTGPQPRDDLLCAGLDSTAVYHYRHEPG
jgi:hypothetical protein